MNYTKDEWMKKVAESVKTIDFSNGFPVLSGKEVDPDWSRSLSDWLYAVSGASMFFGSMCYKAQYNWTFAIPTAGAFVHRGKLNVVFNPYFMTEVLQTEGQRAYVLMHEIRHLMHDHTIRCKERLFDPELWNIACDHYINLGIDAMQEQLVEFRKHYLEIIPEEVFPLCHDKKYEGWTEEQIYDDLVEESKKNPQNKDGDGEGQGKKGPGKGKALDSFADYGEVGDGSDAEARRAIGEAVRAAAAESKASGYKPGDAEAGLINEVLAATEVKVDWKDLLGDWIVQNSDELITYNKISRRNTANIIFPTRTGDSLRIFFGIDTSGSMGHNDLQDGVAGVKQVAELFSEHHISLATADVAGHMIGVIDTNEGVDDFDVNSIPLEGGGGTRMSAMMQLAQERLSEGDDEYDVAIIFTDGELMDGDVDDVYDGSLPVIILITEHGSIPNIECAEKIIQLN